MKKIEHIAIILDGNGRWAKSKGLPRTYGHAQGAKNVETICAAVDDLGIPYLTVYAFSTENWNRPKSEVKELMSLLDNYMKNCIRTAKKNNMRVRVIGDLSGLSHLEVQIKELEQISSQNTGLNFQIALNYGGRDEIVRATKKIAQKVVEDGLKPEDITEELYRDSLDTAGIPDPDLLIRTGGDMRISNYLLWQTAYTEFYFTDTAWPAFGKKELLTAIEEYENRDRRYGRIEEDK